MKKRLLVSRALPDAVMQALTARYALTTRATLQPMDKSECRRALGDFDAVLPTLGDAFTGDVFEVVSPSPKGLRCRILANFGVGYNHIDIAAAQRAGIIVTNTPGAVTDATADIALTLILMSARRAGAGERLVRSGGWQGWHPTQMLGMHIDGKVLGIVGMGRIGRAIARRAHFGFGMKIVFFNRSRVKDAGVPARQLDGLDAVLAASDVVAVAVPGGAGTHHLIDAAALAMMQPHAHLVNISRGDVVDESALIAALQRAQIAGAGLDVFENEPLVPEALRRLENVVLLPHLGTNALEARVAMGMLAVENLDDFFAGKPPPNVVSLFGMDG